jgi:GDSL-like Lipase/Acylhydrolase family
MLKKLTFRSLALFLGVFAGLFCAEISLRVLKIRPQRFPQPRYLVLDNGSYMESGKELGDYRIKRRSRFENLGVGMGEYVPGSRFKAVYANNPRGYFDSDNSVSFEMNSLGLRGPEISHDKPLGTFRILVLGDSFTFGAGVRDEDTFVRRLEKSLNEHTTSKNFEVLNAGVEGYNTRDEVIYLENQWLELDPDLVLIGFYLNDAYPDLTFAVTIKGLNLGVSFVQPSGLARYSYTWDYAQHELHTRKLRRKVDEFYAAAYFSHPKEFLENADDVQVDWSVCRDALKRAMDLTRARNIKIALAVFPEFYRLDAGYPFENIHRLVVETCESISLPACDLLPIYRGMRTDRLWVHITDHHPNEVAHQLAARAIEEFMRARALLDD